MQQFGVLDCLFRYFWQNISSLGPSDLWTLDQMWVLLCLRVSKCLLIMSADPITQEPGTRWTKYYTLFSHPSGLFQVICPQSLTFRMVMSMYLWLGDSVYKLTLFLDWDLTGEFFNVSQGMILVTAQVCQGFSPLVNERKMGGWGQHHHLYGSPQSTVFHLSIQWRIKAISFWEQHPSSYMLREPLLQTVRILGLLSALKNSVGSLPINDTTKTHGIYECYHIISHLDHHGC